MDGARPIDLDALLAQSSWLRRLAAHLVVDPDHADDLVQDTFRAALEHPPAKEAHVRGWLAQVMRHLAINRSRDSDVRRWHELRARRSEPWTAEDVDEGIALQGKVIDAVNTLDEPYRTAITMHYYAGLSAKEIAQKQGENAATIRKRLERGRDILRGRLDREHGGNRAAWCLILAGFLQKEALPIATTAVSKSVLVGALAIGLSLVGLLVWNRLRAESPVVAPEVPVEGLTRLGEPVSPVAPSMVSEREQLLPPAAPDHEKDLFGTVVDGQGAPVANALVEAYFDARASYPWDPEFHAERQRSGRTFTDSMGRFAIRVQPHRPYEIEARAEGFATTVLGFRYPGEEVEVPLNVGASVAGRVVTPDGSPLAGAPLELTTTDGTFEAGILPLREGRTDDSGEFRFDGLPKVEARFRVIPRSQWAPYSVSVRLEPGVERELNVPLVEGKTVRGVVVDAQTHEPIPGAEVGEVWWYRRPGRANERGEFECSGLRSSGPVALQASAEGYGTSIQVLGAPEGSEPIPDRIEFPLERAVTVSGRVVDAQGRPVDGAYVTAVPKQSVDPNIAEVVRIRGRTDARGRFELRDASSRLAYLLLARNEGSGVLVCPFPATNPGANVPLGDLQLPASSCVEGRVVDSVGNPLPNWSLTLLDAKILEERDADRTDPLNSFLAQVLQRFARTDDRGRFSIADLTGGDYVLSARPQGSPSEFTSKISLPPGETLRDVLFRIDGLGSIEGRVTDTGGKGIAGVYVIASQDDPSRYEIRKASTDSSGRFVISGLSRPLYKLTVNPFGIGSDTQAFLPKFIGEVAAGATDVPVVLDSAVRLHGTFVHADGSPVRTGKVIALVPGGDVYTALLNGDGTFAVEVPIGVSIDLEGRASTGRSESEPVARRSSVIPTGSDVLLQLPR